MQYIASGVVIISAAADPPKKRYLGGSIPWKNIICYHMTLES